uniref:TLDc domain-containing protein n=1 Tax=Hucho hucho TaxID=62062 RepID=A0A4W5JGX8_9TELE
RSGRPHKLTERWKQVPAAMFKHLVESLPRTVETVIAASMDNRQGPTILVAYNKAGFVYGGYISKNYAQTGQVINDKAFLYSITDQREKPLRMVLMLVSYGFTDGRHGLNVGVLWFLNGNKAQVSCISGNHYKVNAAEMHGNDLVLTECEVYRVEDLGDRLAKPWRNTLWTSEELKENIQNYRLEVKSVVQARVLLVGQVWAGKSSFFNTINSFFRGNMQAKFHSGKGGKPLPLILCGTMGLEEATGDGLDMDDSQSLTHNSVCVCHLQFNPMAPLQPDIPGYRTHATLNDHIHCVVDVSKVPQMSAKMMDTLAAICKKTIQMGDASLGIPVSCILPVHNYSQECELDQDTDILLLSLYQMLNYFVCENSVEDAYIQLFRTHSR